MADSFDVAARLAEGHTAVDDVTRYVTACHRLGYQHPDLTAHSAQVRDWYASEDGLDLRVLDADCVVLTSLADVAEDAAREQAGLVAALSAAWSGTAAVAGQEFTSRTAESAHAVSGAIRVAADAAASLRDALWSAVDTKVAAVQTIDGRQQAHRPEWLAAAETVTTGAGDVAAASELVDQQVKPFVVGDVGSDWLAAMRTARASIDEAFGRALARTAAGLPAVFDVPGELGPRPAVAESPAVVADSQPTVTGRVGAPSAGWSGVPPGQPASWVATAPMGAPPPAESVAVPASAAPMAAPASTVPASLPAGTAPTPSLGELGGGAAGLGGGASGLGGGLSGFGQQLADLIGSLMGSGDTGLADPADVDLTDEDVRDAESDDGERDDGEADDGEEGDEDEAGERGPEDPPPVDDAADLAAEPSACPEGADGTVGQPPPVATPVAPPADSPSSPPPVAESVADPAEPTPCEIAADELPQVGE